MPSTIALAPMPRTSPTIWSHMRLCRLRGLLAATRAVDRWVLHDPRAWLGTAFHRVMEAAARTALRDRAAAAWQLAVDEAAAAAAAHPLDSRFAVVQQWPGYFLIRQRALASAADAAPKSSAHGTGAGCGVLRAKGVERHLETQDGRLAGRPDYFDGRTITEYKSSLPEPAWPGAQEILDGYRRQLRLYAAIIADVEGRWPENGRIVAASGQVLEMALVPAECAAEAKAALDALEAVNRWLSSGTTAARLATPHPAACGECPFQAICPAFWEWLERAGPQDLAATAVAGEIGGIDIGQDGDLYTAHILVRVASHAMSRDQFIVLRRSAHGDLIASPRGARWRIVSAGIRADGRVKADLWTVVFAEDRVPVLQAA